MIISARAVLTPRARRVCVCHNRVVTGPVVRLYGSAHEGDPPYVLWMCPDGAQRSGDLKVKKVMRETDVLAARQLEMVLT